MNYTDRFKSFFCNIFLGNFSTKNNLSSGNYRRSSDLLSAIAGATFRRKVAYLVDDCLLIDGCLSTELLLFF
ncbi:MAG: hypothetical protein LBB88_04935 [Planctomycetaceae bacterium]|nr:hypothetical protein [Planctomycetaceae bacterium]